MRVLFSLTSTKLFFIVKIIVYGLKMIGLAPFAVSIKSSTKINSLNSHVEIFRVSKIGKFYNILFLVPVLIIVAIKFYLPYIFPENNSEDNNTRFDVEALVLTGEAILFILAACVVIISWANSQKEATSILNKLLEIDAELSLLKQQPFNRQGLIFFIIHVVINVFLWVTFWVRRIVYLHLQSLLSTIFIKIPDYIIYWLIIEYFIVVSIVAEYLKTVNTYLLNFNEFGNYLSRPTALTRNGTLRIPILISPNLDSNGQLSSLKLLHKIRTTLLELCGNIADFFSLPILFCIVCCFIPLIRELFVVSTFSENESITATRTISYIFLIICLYVYPVLSLALKVTLAEKEAKLTGNIIHKLLDAPNVGREIKAELMQFSLQVLHEDVKFTAFGCFTLDSRLLFSMLGGTVSYFMALTQFRTACTSKNSEIASSTVTTKLE